MRNLLEYPVTNIEKIEFLDEMIAFRQRADEQSTGDMRGAILEAIKQDVMKVAWDAFWKSS